MIKIIYQEIIKNKNKILNSMIVFVDNSLKINVLFNHNNYINNIVSSIYLILLII